MTQLFTLLFIPMFAQMWPNPGPGHSSSGGASGPAHVQTHLSKDVFPGSSSSTCAYASNVTSGSTLIASIAWYRGTSDSEPKTISSVTDSLGHTWTQVGTTKILNNTTTGHSNALAVFYFPNTTAGADTVTATFSGTNSTYVMIAASEYSGLNTTPLDQNAESSQLPDIRGTDVITSGNVTTAASNELIYGGCLVDYTLQSAPASGTGLTQRANDDPFAGAEGGWLLIEDKILSSPGTTSATATADAGGTFQGARTFVVTLKP